MSPLAIDLAEVLTGEADLYDELLTLLGEEETALIAGDTRRVADCLARTETLVLKIRLVETSRENLVARLTGRRDTRLSELPDTEMGALSRARARLETTLRRVDRMNARVSALLQRSLGLFRAMLDAVRESAGLAVHYTAEGALVGHALPAIDGRA